MVDAIIALFVLTLGVSLILAFYYRTPPTQGIATLSQDFMDTLSKTKLNDIDDPLFAPTSSIIINGNITHRDNSVLQQLAEFYYRTTTTPPFLSCTFCANLTNTTLYHAVPIENKYNYILMIDDTLVFTKNSTSMDDARLLLPARKIVHGEYRDQLYGPYLVEVYVWE